MTGKKLRRSHPDHTVLRVSKVRVKSVETLTAGFLPRSRLFSFHRAQNAFGCADVQPEAHDKASKCRSMIIGRLRQTRGAPSSLRAPTPPSPVYPSRYTEASEPLVRHAARRLFQTGLVQRSISRSEPPVPEPAGRRFRQWGRGRLRSGTA